MRRTLTTLGLLAAALTATVSTASAAPTAKHKSAAEALFDKAEIGRAHV